MVNYVLGLVLSLLLLASPSMAADPDVGITGSFVSTANTLTLQLQGRSSASVTVSGTWVGTLVAAASADGSSPYTPIQVTAAGVPQDNITANGLYGIHIPPGVGFVQITMTIHTSGTAAVVLHATSAPYMVNGASGTPGGDNSDVQFNNESTLGGNTNFTTDGAGNINLHTATGNPVLSTTGPGSNVSLTLAPKGAGAVIDTGGISYPVATKTTTYAATAGDYLILGDASAGAFTVTLPSAAALSGQVIVVAMISATDVSKRVTVAAGAGDNIEGVSSLTLTTQFAKLFLQTDGVSTWYKVGSEGI